MPKHVSPGARQPACAIVSQSSEGWPRHPMEDGEGRSCGRGTGACRALPCRAAPGCAGRIDRQRSGAAATQPVTRSLSAQPFGENASRLRLFGASPSGVVKACGGPGAISFATTYSTRASQVHHRSSASTFGILRQEREQEQSGRLKGPGRYISSTRRSSPHASLFDLRSLVLLS